jgi:hypothetical protein
MLHGAAGHRATGAIQFRTPEARTAMDRAQHELEPSQTDPHDIDLWTSAISLAREALVGLQIEEDMCIDRRRN